MAHDHPGYTPAERVAVLYGYDDWCEHEWRAAHHQPGITPTMAALHRRAQQVMQQQARRRAAQQEETPMREGGRITRAEFEWHASLARRLWRPEVAEQRIAVWRELVDDPDDGVRASAGQDDGGVDEEFAHLWPPGQLLAEAEERDKIAAAAGAKAKRRGKAAAAQAARDAVAERQRIAAAAAARAAQDELDDDEMFARLWPEGQYEP